MSQRCVALKIVGVNRLVSHHLCSIDDVIVYDRNELWVIEKYMVKCRVESVVVYI